MKRFSLIMFLVVVVLPGYSFASDLGDAYVSYIQGDVQINIEESGEWMPAEVNMPLKDNDRIWVAQGGRAEIKMRNNSTVRLDKLTSVDIIAAPGTSEGFKINKGSVYFNYNGSGTLNITTPMSTLWAYEQAKLRVDVSETGFAEVAVFRGRVNTEIQEVRLTIPEGRYLPYTGRYTSDLRPLRSADEWDRWNAQSDGYDAGHYASSRYLPEELAPYSRDFDAHGKWVYVSDYGYCWKPAVVVSVGWAPYKAGRWVWIRGDYVWVSSEPWGWAPYHYGRWSFVVPHGWVWVPPARGEVFWGPGFVAWVHTPTHVAWVPLAPREIYYGRGYYGPHSVNITKVTANKNVVNINIYRNVNTHYAVTTVSRDSFVKGRPLVVKNSENIFRQKEVVYGRPEVKFEKAKTVNVINNRSITINNTRTQKTVSSAPVRSLSPAPQFKTAPVQARTGETPKNTKYSQRDVQPQREQWSARPAVQQRQQAERPGRPGFSSSSPVQERQRMDVRSKAPKQQPAVREQRMEKENRSIGMKNMPMQNSNIRSGSRNSVGRSAFGMPVKADKQQRGQNRKDKT